MEHSNKPSSDDENFEILSDLCTILVVGESEGFLLVPDVVPRLKASLKAARNNGDLLVMGARALGLLMENFRDTLPLMEKADVESVCWCFNRISSLVSVLSEKNNSMPQFSRLTPQDLVEELLKCMSLGLKISLLSGFLPPVPIQLRFCQSTAGDSMWIACKVLQHCMLLSRSEQLTTANDVHSVEQMVLSHIQTLSTTSKVDYDWDELLRTITFCVVTLRRKVCTPLKGKDEKKETQKKRQRKDLHDGRECADHKSFDDLSSSRFINALLQQLFHILVSVGDSCPDIRLNLLLACVDTVFTDSDMVDATAGEHHCKMLKLLHSVLRRQTQTRVFFSDPFTKQKTSVVRGSVGDGEDSDRNSLPSLQWILPSITWCALSLLSKLLGGFPFVESEYIWASRGESDTYFLYRPKHRALLTQMFVHGAREVPLPGRKRCVDLVRFTEKMHFFSPMVVPVHFQPVPVSQKLLKHSLSVNKTGEKRAISVLSAYDGYHELNKVLQTLSFGVTPETQLAKMVHFHLVCHASPEDCESTRAPFRDLVALGAVEELEKISERLLRRDPRWGAVLLKAGVADAFRNDGSLVEPPKKVSRCANWKICSDRPAEMTERSPKRVSPVMEILQSSKEALKAVENLSLLPMSSEKITEMAIDGTQNGISAFIEACKKRSISVQEVHGALEKLTSREAFIPLLESFLARELHVVTLEGQKQQLIPMAVQFENTSVFICQNKDSGSAAQCPGGHNLMMYHGVEWSCNMCQQQTAYGSYACRLCNYDLCYACLEKSSRCMPVSCTATVRDVSTAWRKLKCSAASVQKSSMPSPTASCAFTSTGILSMVARAHSAKSLHIQSMDEPCLCHTSTPEVLHRSALLCEETPLTVLLQAFGKELFSEVGGPVLGLYGAIEGAGTAIALHGAAGLPPLLQEIIVGLQTCLSSSVKHEICHFIEVDCPRYANTNLIEGHVLFPGAIHPSNNENGNIGTKAQVPRSNEDFLQILFSTFSQSPSTLHKVEFSFKGEVGTGNGPTQEVYAQLSRFFKSESAGSPSAFWYVRDDGLSFPCPSQKTVFAQEFYVLGAACGRCFVDGYVMEVEVLPAVWDLARRGAAHTTLNYHSLEEILWELLRLLDDRLYKSYQQILLFSDGELEELGLEDPTGCVVTSSTAASYVQSLLTEHFKTTLTNIRYFTLGILTCVDLNVFWFLSSAELNAIFCGVACGDSTAKLFTEEEFRSVVQEAHGYEAGSPVVAQLISIVGNSFSRTEQEHFIEFLTGVPRLPVNGLRGLNKKITVVKKDMEGDREETLPSCSTCFLYLKLPPYSLRETMHQRLLLAVTEGRRNFSLS